MQFILLLKYDKLTIVWGPASVSTQSLEWGAHLAETCSLCSSLFSISECPSARLKSLRSGDAKDRRVSFAKFRLSVEDQRMLLASKTLGELRKECTDLERNGKRAG